MIRFNLKWLAVTATLVAAPLLALLAIQGTAMAVTVSPSATGQVVYAIGYEDNCDGTVEVAIANATPDTVTFTVNGVDVAVEPMGIEHLKVLRPEKGKAEVRVKVKLGPGRPDKANHTWVKPKVCTSGSPSASASASATPAPSVSASTVAAVDQPQLALTGFNTGMAGAVGLGMVAMGGTLYLVGRQRRRAQHAVR